MKSFNEYISEQPVIQPAVPVAPTSPAPSEDEPTDIDHATVCDVLLMVYTIMGCVGAGPDTDTGVFDCEAWAELMVKFDCWSGPSEEEE